MTTEEALELSDRYGTVVEKILAAEVRRLDALCADQAGSVEASAHAQCEAQHAREAAEAEVRRLRAECNNSTESAKLLYEDAKMWRVRAQRFTPATVREKMKALVNGDGPFNQPSKAAVVVALLNWLDEQEGGAE